MNRSTFIFAMCGLHFFTAALLLFSAAPMGVTAVRSLAQVFVENRFVLAAIYASAAGLAVWRECRNAKTGRSAWWYVPQLFITTCGAMGALLCIVNGAYADGIQRPMPFIARDQIIYPILAWLYFRSISRP